jgi:hypothetical protein
MGATAGVSRIVGPDAHRPQRARAVECDAAEHDGGISVTVSAAAPIAAAIFYNPEGLRIKLLIIGVAIWTTAAVLLHLAAQYVLGRLRSP